MLNYSSNSVVNGVSSTAGIHNIDYFYNLQNQGSSTLDIMIEIEREKKATIKFYQDFLNDLDNSPLE